MLCCTLRTFEFDTICFMCSCTRTSFSTTRDERTTAVYVTVPVNAGHVRRRLASPITCSVGDIITGRACPRPGARHHTNITCSVAARSRIQSSARSWTCRLARSPQIKVGNLLVFYCAMLCIRGICYGPCVCLCMSVTSRCLQRSSSL